ncbi:MAG: hypothetical protein AAGF26_07885 [Cyanobacteria bacterium P01_G01_bin.49]
MKSENLNEYFPNVEKDEIEQEVKKIINFKQYLLKLAKDAGVSQDEMAKGLKISRSLVARFLAADDDNHDSRLLLPINRLSLINLWTNIIERTHHLNDQQREYREKLQKRNKNEFLEIFKYNQRKSFSLNDIEISKKRSQQLSRLIALLDNIFLEDGVFLEIVEDIEQKINGSIKKKIAFQENIDSKQQNKDLIYYQLEAQKFLESSPFLRDSIKDKILNKFKRSLETSIFQGKRSFSNSE